MTTPTVSQPKGKDGAPTLLVVDRRGWATRHPHCRLLTEEDGPPARKGGVKEFLSPIFFRDLTGELKKLFSGNQLG